MPDISFLIDTSEFSVRAAGIACHNDYYLLCCYKTVGNESFWFTPGGRVLIGESAKDAVVRELLEETGEQGICKELLWVTESLISTPSESAHQLTFYFRLEIPSLYSNFSADKIFQDLSGDPNLTLSWVSTDELATLNLKPSFVKKHLLDRSFTFQFATLLNER